MSTCPRARDEVVAIVNAQHPTAVTSQQIADEMQRTRSWARACLRELVRTGVLDVSNGEGGIYEWSST